MSSKDKTRQKLVGSMRKTKASAGIGPGNSHERAQPPAAPVAEPPKKQAVAQTRRARSNAESGDRYRSGRRVWPD
jgi:hypothetical protein